MSLSSAAAVGCKIKSLQPSSTISERVIKVRAPLHDNRDPFQASESYSVHSVAFELVPSLQGPSFVSRSPLGHQSKC